jgi:phosphatidate cytidylyltransferase
VDATAVAVRWTFAIIFVVLLAATVLARGNNARASAEELRKVRLRIRSWWIILIMFAVAILGGRVTTVVFFALVSFLALKEYLTVVPTRRADRSLLFFCYLAIPLQYWWVGSQWYWMFTIFVPVYLFLFIPVEMVIAGETKGFLRAAGTVHWGLMTTVFALSHAAYLFMLPGTRSGGAGLVLYLVLLTELNDVFQYIWGKKLGRRKIIPKISPNKTWEGFLGGLGTTTALSVIIAPHLTPLGANGAAIAGLIIATAGFFGDLAMSGLKRDLNIKDTSEYIPGHGGVLDRVDSLTYTAPLFFHLLRYFYYQ